MRIESAVTRLLLSKPYPDRDSVFLVYSRYNKRDLFWRARETVITAGVNFDICYKEFRIFSNKLKIFFIDDIEYRICGTGLEGFWYDEEAFRNSRTFVTLVRPSLIYRYGTSVKIE